MLTNAITNVLMMVLLRVAAPCAETPWLTRWVEAETQWGRQWMVQGSATAGFCQDVTVGFTTEAGKVYAVEGCVPGEHDPRRIGTETAPYFEGTGEVVVVRFGWGWDRGFWRVKKLN